MIGLTTGERSLLQWASQISSVAISNQRLGARATTWRYNSVAELLLRAGRLFTPAPFPEEQRGPDGQCFTNASAYADETQAVYVEGLAACENILEIHFEHAWCAGDDKAIDPTWTAGAAYLGIPVTNDYRRHRQETTGSMSLLSAPAVFDLLKHGLPAAAIVNIGRPVPPECIAPQGIQIIGQAHTAGHHRSNSK